MNYTLLYQGMLQNQGQSIEVTNGSIIREIMAMVHFEDVADEESGIVGRSIYFDCLSDDAYCINLDSAVTIGNDCYVVKSKASNNRGLTTVTLEAV